MQRRKTSAGEKAIFGITAAGGVLIVVALTYFAMSGSPTVLPVIPPTVGGALGSVAAFLATRSRSSGRFIAGLLILACVCASGLAVALVFSYPEESAALLSRNGATTTFVCSFVVAVFGTVLFRLLGKETAKKHDRGGQASRRRS